MAFYDSFEASRKKMRRRMYIIVGITMATVIAIGGAYAYMGYLVMYQPQVVKGAIVEAGKGVKDIIKEINDYQPKGYNDKESK